MAWIALVPPEEARGKLKELYVTRLGQAGFDDADVSEITAITAYFNMVNRIASALGIEGRSGLAPR